ncbi:MAG: glutamate--tRNA ligase [Bacillota bacterium]|jgi:glutamyl-tRNA synthetase|nr:glutamate--tRNA ligase [Bacillota bacterium]HHU43778.1 glutamate--tRNA ligase [Clostridiales bacterium]
MIRTRFAPSPTGFMHIGNLRTALYAYLFAKKHKGKFILRIEDTDRERYVEGAVDAIYATLRKAGIFHDEGPDVGGGYGPYIQSQRKDIYMEYALKLIERGGAYYCFCDKERLGSLADEKGVKRYDKHCLKLSKKEVQDKLDAGEEFVIRQNMPTEGLSSYEDMVFGKITVPNDELEDNILIKVDGMPTYNFANVVDDHLMGITHVIRGTEYLSSTPKYNLIYEAMGWQTPNYMHLPPIMKDQKRKLSKRYGDANFEDFLNKGYLPHAIVNYIALLGWSPKDNQEKLSMQELIDAFDIDGISKSPSIFDEQKMKWLNAQYIRELTLEEFHDIALSYYQKMDLVDKFDTLKLSQLLHGRCEVFSDIYNSVDFLTEFGDFDLGLYYHKRMKTDFKAAKPLIEEALKALKEIEFTTDSIMDALTRISEKMGVKKGQTMYSVRVALTGRASTPGGAIEMAELLGKDESLRRLKKSLEMIKKAEHKL